MYKGVTGKELMAGDVLFNIDHRHKKFNEPICCIQRLVTQIEYLVETGLILKDCHVAAVTDKRPNEFTLFPKDSNFLVSRTVQSSQEDDEWEITL